MEKRMPTTPYLQYTRNGYRYRKRVPDALQVCIGKKNIIVQLETHCRRTASLRMASVHLATCELLERAGYMGETLTHKQAEEVAIWWKQRLLNIDFNQRLSGNKQHETSENTASMLATASTRLSKLETSSQANRISQITDEIQLNIQPTSSDWNLLAYYLLKEDVDRLKEQVKRSQSPTNMTYFHEAESKTPTFVTLTQAFDGWKRSTRRNAKTVSDWHVWVRRFVEFRGDKAVNTITRIDIRDFLDACEKYPKNPKHVDKQLTFPEIIKKYETRNVDRLKTKTINKGLDALHSIFRWCKKKVLINKNPAEDMKLEEPKHGNRQSDRLPFSLSELKIIFMDSPVFSSGFRPRAQVGEAAYWVPILFLYSGARPEELCQLGVDDIDCVWGIDFMRINDDKPGTSVKTDSSVRNVPLHPEVIRLGFLDYVKRMKQLGNTYLFPHIRSTKFNRSGNFSKWVNRYLRTTCGITEKRKVFYSLRHNFKDICRDSGIRDEINDRLTGHKNGSVAWSYGLGHGVKILYEELKNVEYPGLVIPKLGIY